MGCDLGESERGGEKGRGGSGGGNRGGWGGGGGFNDNGGFAGEYMEAVDWSQAGDLVTFEKNFYSPTEASRNMGQDKVEEYR